MHKIVPESDCSETAADTSVLRKVGYLPGRLAAIDELRALAIMSMVLAHFGPGALQRIPNSGAYLDAILFWGHFATVTFILVFGITVGFVHYERYYSGDRERVVSRLFARARLVLLCAIIIGIPDFVSQCTNGKFELLPCLVQFYSPLNFYVLAFLSAPYWLMALQRRPLRNALLLGVGHWIVAAILLAIWSGGTGFAEYIRLNLVSGPYAYFQLAGCALLAMPVGIYLRKAVTDGTYLRFMLVLILLGSTLTGAGWALGQWVNEFDIHAINTGELKAPPRVWYWMFFAGPTFLMLAGLVTVELRVPVLSKFFYPLALFGIGALPIYTAHIFVLPALGFLSTMFAIEGFARIVLPLLMFGAFCLVVMWYYHSKLRGRRAAFAR